MLIQRSIATPSPHRVVNHMKAHEWKISSRWTRRSPTTFCQQIIHPLSKNMIHLGRNDHVGQRKKSQIGIHHIKLHHMIGSRTHNHLRNWIRRIKLSSFLRCLKWCEPTSLLWKSFSNRAHMLDLGRRKRGLRYWIQTLLESPEHLLISFVNNYCIFKDKKKILWSNH